jgi:hypothetical protein
MFLLSLTMKQSGFYKDGDVPTTPKKSNATNKSKIQSMIDMTDSQTVGRI